jgi:hypothetical protein
MVVFTNYFWRLQSGENLFGLDGKVSLWIVWIVGMTHAYYVYERNSQKILPEKKEKVSPGPSVTLIVENPDDGDAEFGSVACLPGASFEPNLAIGTRLVLTNPDEDPRIVGTVVEGAEYVNSGGDKEVWLWIELDDPDNYSVLIEEIYGWEEGSGDMRRRAS